jgi:uncharacterized protein YndB with AHSA1/START domain
MPDAADLPNEIELVFTRHFDAPVALVWRAWTDPAMIAQWWAPEPLKSVVESWDARPGGRIKLVMVGDGAEHPMTGVFDEVVPQTRIVITGKPIDETGEPFATNRMVTTFTPENGGTRVETHASLVAHSPMGRFALQGMTPGYNSALDQLEALLAGG